MGYAKVGLKTGDTITQAALDRFEAGIVAAADAADAAASAAGAATTVASGAASKADSAVAAAAAAGDPGGRVLFVRRAGGNWPARPTDRTDVMVLWVGADPSPAIVTSGTGGMIDGVDARLVSP